MPQVAYASYSTEINGHKWTIEICSVTMRSSLTSYRIAVELLESVRQVKRFLRSSLTIPRSHPPALGDHHKVPLPQSEVQE